MDDLTPVTVQTVTVPRHRNEERCTNAKYTDDADRLQSFKIRTPITNGIDPVLLLPTDYTGVISDNDDVRCVCPVPAKFAFGLSPVASDLLYRSTVPIFL